MCESKQHKFRTQRNCETWARKERDRRIVLILAVEKTTVGWTAYYKKKSIYGSFLFRQQKYPFVAALDAQTVCKAHYDACAFFKDKIHLLDNALEKHEHSLREAISDTLTGKGTVKRGLLNKIVS